MNLEPLHTSAATMVGGHKVLLYSRHGWGKTTQALHMQKHFGPGFIISGEGGLRSVGDTHIDYLPFQSWDGENDPANGIYSLKAIMDWVRTDDFKSRGYKWIMLDSLTEASDMLLADLHAKTAKSGKADDKKNGFKIWEDYAIEMLGRLKMIRDLPYHFVVTALAKDETDADGNVTYWPAIKGNVVAKQLCGIFDHVLAGVRVTKRDGDGDDAKEVVKRYIVTDEIRGYVGKVRDPNRSLSQPFWEGGDITELLALFSAAPSGSKD